MHSYNVGVNLKIVPALGCIESVSRISNLILHSKKLIITRSGTRFARPLLVYEFRDCCFDWLPWRAGIDCKRAGWRSGQGRGDVCGPCTY